MPPAEPPVEEVSRRNVLVGSGVAALALAGGYTAFALYGPSSGKTSSVPRTTVFVTPTGPPPQAATSAGAGTSAPAPTAAGGPPLAKLADIPENGGIVLTDQKIVLTRATGDEVHAFSAVCTHAGCLVSTVSGGTINCPCHGSSYDATTGAVVGGPAPAPLAAVPVAVVNGVVEGK